MWHFRVRKRKEEAVERIVAPIVYIEDDIVSTFLRCDFFLLVAEHPFWSKSDIVSAVLPHVTMSF